MMMGKNFWLNGLLGGLITFNATPAFAKSINFKDAGVLLWIFIIIGAIIVLLQLIPALVLFFSFIGTSTGLLAQKKRPEEERSEGKVVFPSMEPTPVKK
jgi:flagellar basal body-associated protein FliL